ncbi:hypothetical protein QBC35DRAFT_534680 [Podospora australis]|uniref:Fungal N-terminal domain-containing protein n=1 Tax=Podospora australis TaxID=1536484 RepID=A0AAN7AF11_9PEZI|nr:hypothetical protein QBC35DRAFT_534680 [Podospora australis]
MEAAGLALSVGVFMFKTPQAIRDVKEALSREGLDVLRKRCKHCLDHLKEVKYEVNRLYRRTAKVSRHSSNQGIPEILCAETTALIRYCRDTVKMALSYQERYAKSRTLRFLAVARGSKTERYNRRLSECDLWMAIATNTVFLRANFDAAAHNYRGILGECRYRAQQLRKDALEARTYERNYGRRLKKHMGKTVDLDVFRDHWHIANNNLFTLSRAPLSSPSGTVMTSESETTLSSYTRTRSHVHMVRTGGRSFLSESWESARGFSSGAFTTLRINPDDSGDLDAARREIERWQENRRRAHIAGQAGMSTSYHNGQHSHLSQPAVVHHGDDNSPDGQAPRVINVAPAPSEYAPHISPARAYIHELYGSVPAPTHPYGTGHTVQQPYGSVSSSIPAHQQSTHTNEHTPSYPPSIPIAPSQAPISIPTHDGNVSQRPSGPRQRQRDDREYHEHSSDTHQRNQTTTTSRAPSQSRSVKGSSQRHGSDSALPTPTTEQIDHALEFETRRRRRSAARSPSVQSRVSVRQSQDEPLTTPPQQPSVPSISSGSGSRSLRTSRSSSMASTARTSIFSSPASVHSEATDATSHFSSQRSSTRRQEEEQEKAAKKRSHPPLASENDTKGRRSLRAKERKRGSSGGSSVPSSSSGSVSGSSSGGDRWRSGGSSSRDSGFFSGRSSMA